MPPWLPRRWHTCHGVPRSNLGIDSLAKEDLMLADERVFPCGFAESPGRRAGTHFLFPYSEKCGLCGTSTNLQGQPGFVHLILLRFSQPLGAISLIMK